VVCELFVSRNIPGKNFPTCPFVWISRGAANSERDAAVLVEAVEGVPLGARNHLKTVVRE